MFRQHIRQADGNRREPKKRRRRSREKKHARRRAKRAHAGTLGGRQRGSDESGNAIKHERSRKNDSAQQRDVEQNRKNVHEPHHDQRLHLVRGNARRVFELPAQRRKNFSGKHKRDRARNDKRNDAENQHGTQFFEMLEKRHFPPDEDSSPSRSRETVSEISSASSSFMRPRSRKIFRQKKTRALNARRADATLRKGKRPLPRKRSDKARSRASECARENRKFRP